MGNSSSTRCGCPGQIPATGSRRDFLRYGANGFGMLALSGLMGDRAYAAAPKTPGPHFPAKAKNVIFLFMEGGPSHVDTFDPKPELNKREGEPIGVKGMNKKSQTGASRVWMGSPWKFAQHGKSGQWISELFPHTAKLADKLCVVRSMVGDLPLHGQQNLLLHTGRVLGQAPSMGAWVNYGLGTENQNLPGFVVLNNDYLPHGGMDNFGSSYLPATFQAMILRAKGKPVDNVQASDNAVLQRRKLALLAEQDGAFAASTSNSMEIESAIRNYETAFRMQTLLPELADVSREPEHIRALYGVDAKDDSQRYYATQCLRARRLVEAGVRFVEVAFANVKASVSPWDQHSDIKKLHEQNAMICDQAVAALIADLDQRGLLDETVVLWAGEMGRTPHTAKIAPNCGRDHHVNGYSIFLAGGGFKPGTTFGATDEFGNSVVEAPLAIHDIHATILRQLGLDHEKLIFRFGGRDMSLTDVHGRVVTKILA